MADAATAPPDLEFLVECQIERSVRSTSPMCSTCRNCSRSKRGWRYNCKAAANSRPDAPTGSQVLSDTIRSARRRRSTMRRRHVAAPTHQMATVPDAFADYTGTRLSINRRECGNERRKQNERYKFAHGSILEQNRIANCAEQHASLPMCQQVGGQQASFDVARIRLNVCDPRTTPLRVRWRSA
jgi:hypothetical protein